MNEARAVAIVAAIAVAPIAIVLIVAMLRGYSIRLNLERKPPRDDDA